MYTPTLFTQEIANFRLIRNFTVIRNDTIISHRLLTPSSALLTNSSSSTPLAPFPLSSTPQVLLHVHSRHHRWTLPLVKLYERANDLSFEP